MEATWTFLGTWSFEPALAVGLILSAAAYLWAVHEVDRRQPEMRWPRRYTTSFMCALALAWFVLLGPIGAFDDTFFWAHMVQHMALMMLIGPLLLLGAPVLLILRVSNRRVRRTWVVPVLRSRVMNWLTRPLVGWLIFAGVLLGTHFSPWYEFALEHPLVHNYVEHPLYLGAALIYYYPLLPVNPGPRRVPYWLRALSLFSMMFPETMTGFFIFAAGYQMYPFYSRVDRPFGPGPRIDQQTGGAIMWAGSMLIDAIWVSLAVLDWLHSESRAAARIDIETLKKPAGYSAARLMTAGTESRDRGDERERDENQIRWWSAASVRLHGTLIVGVAICSIGTWIEWTRALSGHAVAWGYSFEWPLFAVMGTYLWWKLLHADLPTTPRRSTRQSEPSMFRRHRQALPAAEDAGLLAWQEYVDRLNAADPPGGPPAGPVRGHAGD